MAWRKEHWPIGFRVVFIFEKTLSVEFLGLARYVALLAISILH